MIGEEKLAELEGKIGYSFGNRALLRRATTHRSFAAEHNERLEFLGDSVLGCVIGRELFGMEQHFSEGRLSRVRSNLVCESTLAEIARSIGLGEYLLLGEGELKTGGRSRPSILADAVEAIIGAVFFESGFEAAQRVVLGLYRDVLADLPERMGKDAKSRLQETLQAGGLALPVYRVVECAGEPNDQVFTCECAVASFGIAERGRGRNRRAAEQEAAERSLRALQELPAAAHLKKPDP